MMSRAVDSTAVGYQYLRSSVSSGHPSVEKGHSAEENQVSSVSGSCSIAEEPQAAHASGSSSATVTWPSGQYHAGMRCPSQSWREMHQSRMFSIQSRYVRVYGSSGMNLTFP